MRSLSVPQVQSEKDRLACCHAAERKKSEAKDNNNNNNDSAFDAVEDWIEDTVGHRIVLEGGYDTSHIIGESSTVSPERVRTAGAGKVMTGVRIS
jgi:hypothetical protein